MRSYIHSALDIEYGSESNEPSEPQWAFHRLWTELPNREEALIVAIAKVGTLQPLLETER